MTKRTFVGLSLGAVAALLTGGRVSAGLQKPTAAQLVDRSEAAYHALAALHQTVVKALTTAGGVPGTDQHQTADIRLERPNLLRIEGTIQNGHDKPLRYVVVCDGKHLWDWDSSDNTYTEAPAPAALRDIPAPFPVYQWPGMPFLLGEDEVTRGLQKKMGSPPPGGALHGGKFAGMPLSVAAPATFAGVPCDVLVCRMSAPKVPIYAAYRLYLGRADHLFRGMESESGASNGKDRGVAFRMKTTYPDVDTSPQFSPADFTFTPPPGAKRKRAAVSGAGGKRRER